MREIVTVQVGQCGNQIGNKFWGLLLKEHERTPDTDDALSAFFRFAPQPDGRTHAMKARAMLVDMECGPLTETMRSPLGALFDETQYVMDVYGAGNNFAHGFAEYGPKYRNHFCESLRRVVEHCDSLQTFFVMHSLGGGTGSGVGSYLLGLLHDEYPEVFRFSCCVYPTEDADVVTSPYNSILSTNQLIEHADCVFPVDNSALQSFAALEFAQQKKAKAPTESASYAANSGPPPAGLPSSKSKSSKDKGFDEMNNVAARMLSHLTASSRFNGEMNVDMNEICTNLVPYPKIHFLMTALSPQRAISGRAMSSSSSSSSSSIGSSSLSHGGRSAVQRAFGDILSKTGQISGSDPSTEGCITVSSAFITRGKVSLSDFLYCVTAAQRQLTFPVWNADACKVLHLAQHTPANVTD
jgi:tubulin epsilon